MVAGVECPERAEGGNRDEHGMAAGGGSPGGDDVAQRKYLGSAEVFRPAGRAGFYEADQALGEVACVKGLEGQARGDREQAMAQHLVQGRVKLRRPLDRRVAGGCHELLGLPFRPVVGPAEPVDADDGGVDHVGAGPARSCQDGAGPLDFCRRGLPER